jgi:hypothetical protein
VDYTAFASPEDQKKRHKRSSASGVESDAEDTDFHVDAGEDSDDQVEEIDPFEVGSDVLTLKDREKRQSKIDNVDRHVSTVTKFHLPTPAAFPKPTADSNTLGDSVSAKQTQGARPLIKQISASSKNGRPAGSTSYREPIDKEAPLNGIYDPANVRTYQLVSSDPIMGLVPLPPTKDTVNCKLCSNVHEAGKCPLREIELQQCPACGYVHIHQQRTCPMLQNLEYVEALYQRLKDSTEDKAVIKAAKVYLRGIRADLRLRKGEGRNRKGG